MNGLLLATVFLPLIGAVALWIVAPLGRDAIRWAALVVTVGTDLGFSYALSAVINNWFYRRKALAMSAFQAIDTTNRGAGGARGRHRPRDCRLGLADHDQDHGPRPAHGHPAPGGMHHGGAGAAGPHHGRRPAPWRA